MSKDHSQDIRSCVQILQNNAVAAAISKEKARSSRTIEILRKNVLSLIEEDDLDHALLQDMDFWHSPEETDETIPPKKKARLQPSPNITDCSPMNMQTLPTVKVGKKMEKRSGKDVITDQASFRRMRNTKDKLDFIVQHADKDTGKYINSHRHWLLRINPIAECFTVCCNRDFPLFVTKHCNKNGNFSVNGLQGLPGCVTCRNKMIGDTELKV